ncbi:MAG: hypothetical protein COS84_00105, partial [Armatimonadetes bacterium CG07_land_8_20_14_0_80_40_9]
NGSFTPTLLWRYPQGFYSSPAVAEGVLYAGVGSGFVALSAQSGELLWESQINTLSISSPAVDKDKVYIGSRDGHLYCYNKETGALIWQSEKIEPIGQSVAVAEGVVYIGSGVLGSRGKFYAFDANTGELLWKYPLSGDLLCFTSSAVIAKDIVYVVNGNESIYAFDTRENIPLSSRLKWRSGFKAWGWASPAVGNGAIYYPCADGKLYAFKPGVYFPEGRHYISIPLLNPTNYSPSLLDLNLKRLKEKKWIKEDKRTTVGEGYLLETERPLVIEVEGDLIEESSQGYKISLSPGLNLIGNPFVYNINWSDESIKVEYQAETVSLSQAVSRGWIGDGGKLVTLSGRKTSSNNWRYQYYTFSPNSIPPAQFIPWRGYKIIAGVDCNLVILPNPSGVQSIVSTTKDWFAQFTVRVGDIENCTSFLGEAPDATDGYDQEYDIKAPPLLPERYIELYFPHEDSQPGWEEEGGDYISDIRSPLIETNFKAWDFQVVTDQVGKEATVRWNLRESDIPANYKVTLIDLDEGESLDMRKVTSYSYSTTSEEEKSIRNFKLIVSDESLAEISNLKVTPSIFSPNEDNLLDTTEISFELSEPGKADVGIYTKDGLTLIKSFPENVEPQTSYLLTWDGKDESGIYLDEGSYIVKVDAVSSKGEVMVGKTAKIVLDKSAPIISGLVAFSFSPNGDGFNDTTTIS